MNYLRENKMGGETCDSMPLKNKLMKGSPKKKRRRRRNAVPSPNRALKDGEGERFASEKFKFDEYFIFCFIPSTV